MVRDFRPGFRVLRVSGFRVEGLGVYGLGLRCLLSVGFRPGFRVRLWGLCAGANNLYR